MPFWGVPAAVLGMAAAALAVLVAVASGVVLLEQLLTCLAGRDLPVQMRFDGPMDR